jgi:hypothetical protein
MDESTDWRRDQYPVSPKGIEKWVQASSLYGSQISTFWEDGAQLQSEIEKFSAFMGGLTLWSAVEE